MAILDADKEGFLRSETSLIQTAGRAARHVDGRVIMYADTVTDSMRRMMEVTDARRATSACLQPGTRHHPHHGAQGHPGQPGGTERGGLQEGDARSCGRVPRATTCTRCFADLEREMVEAAEALEFERAAMLRDQIKELEGADQPAAPRRARPNLKTRYTRSRGKRQKSRGA